MIRTPSAVEAVEIMADLNFGERQVMREQIPNKVSATADRHYRHIIGQTEFMFFSSLPSVSRFPALKRIDTPDGIWIQRACHTLELYAASARTVGSSSMGIGAAQIFS